MSEDLEIPTVPGSEIEVRVTPKASSNRVFRRDAQLLVHVTCAPEKGKANEAVRKLLSKATGVAKSRLVLVRGDTSRDKVFRIDG